MPSARTSSSSSRRSSLPTRRCALFPKWYVSGAKPQRLPGRRRKRSPPGPADLALCGFADGSQWSSVERNNKAGIHEQKIRCAYLPAEDGSGNANGIPEEEEGSPHDNSRLDESVSSSFHDLRLLGGYLRLPAGFLACDLRWPIAVYGATLFPDLRVGA